MIRPTSNISWMLVYFLFAFGITWATGISVVLSNQTGLVNGPKEPEIFNLPFPVAVLLILIGDYGPAIAAIIVGFLMTRGAGIRGLFRQLRRWRLNPLLYLVALFLTMGIDFLTVGLFIVAGSSISGSLFVAPTFFQIGGLFFGPLGEELGFRGLAQPTLQKSYGLLTSSLTVGGLWFLWQQWPLFGPAAFGGLDFGAITITLVYILAVSVIFGWLYNASNQSLLVILFAHAGLDLQKEVAPSLLSSTFPYAVTTVLVCVVAFALAVRQRSRLKKQTQTAFSR